MKVSLMSLAALSLVAGCVVAPYDGQPVEPHRAAIPFSGYTNDPLATVEVQVEDFCGNEWLTVATTTAASSGFLYGGYDLYPWAVTVDLTGDPNIACYGTNGLNPSTSIHFRVKADGSNLANLPGGGYACVTSAVAGGADLVSAGATCGASYDPSSHSWMN